jgi:hypothetical protein
VVCFAYPFGKSDEASVEIVATVGFRMAFDAAGGPARLDGELDRWNVPRVEVSGEWSLATFAAVMEEIEAEGWGGHGRVRQPGDVVRRVAGTRVT